MPFHIKTFGCKVNFHDSALLKERLASSGLKKPCAIINSCSVTHEAAKEALRHARRLKQKNPSLFVAVTGCAAQTETSLYESSPYVDLVAGASYRDQLPAILKEKEQGRRPPKALKLNIFKNPAPLSKAAADEGTERTRAFLKIQDGCSQFCSFCVIPFARGLSRSFPISYLVERGRALSESGAPEIALTGVHIGDYRDGNRGLADLIESLLRIASLKRLRLSSLEPGDLSPKLLELFQDERLCPHIHLSAQSACSKTLRAMRRRDSRSDVERALSLIARRIPGAFVGIDIIAGFAGESQEDFEETYQVLKERPWTRLHVFPYSPRPGTAAARHLKAGEAPRAEIMKRAGFLRRLGEARFQGERRKQAGALKKALFFKKSPARGLSRDYWPVSLEKAPSGPKTLAGKEARVRIKGLADDSASLAASLV